MKLSITRESIELWLPCKSFPNLEVSNQGRVKILYSTKRANIGRLLNQRDDKDGYKIIAVNRTTVRVHRLVAEAFIPNPNNNEVVHHKDNIKDNNDASNLEWTTISFNTKHAYSIGAIRSPYARYVKASIDGEVFSYYDSCSQCAEHFNIGRDPIEKCVTSGTLFKDFVKLEEVEKIPHGAIRDKELTTKEIGRRINPHRIMYKCGKELIIESPLDLIDVLQKERSTIYRIMRGSSWRKYNIQSITPIPEEEYYRLHINW